MACNFVAMSLDSDENKRGKMLEQLFVPLVMLNIRGIRPGSYRSGTMPRP